MRDMVEVYLKAMDECGDYREAIKAVATAATQAERHRIYAALEADPGALWRDQGFQEWRKNRQESDGR